jgi:hypothetical protein
MAPIFTIKVAEIPLPPRSVTVIVAFFAGYPIIPELPYISPAAVRI